MRKSLLLLLTLTFTWFGAKSNTFVAAANTADPIVEQAYKSVFSSLNTSTVFGKFVRGMVMADNAPGCPTDIVVSQLTNPNSCEADSIEWTEPTPEAAVTTPTDTVVTNVKTGAVLAWDVSSPKLYNVPVGEYKISYNYDVATVPVTQGSCVVLLTVLDNMNPDLDISAISAGAVLDTLTVATTDSTCATAKDGLHIVDPLDIIRPSVIDLCDASSMVSYIIKNSAGNIVGSDDTLTMAEGNLAASLNDTILFPIGFNYVIFTAYDTTGNTTVDTLVINVKDITAPIFSDTIAVSDTLIAGNSFGTDNLSTDLGSDTKNVTYLIPGATDNCSINGYSYSIVGGAVNITGTGNNVNATLPVGTFLFTYTVKDASGNTESTEHTIVVSDNEAPTVVCPNDEFTGPFYVTNTCEFDFTTESVAGQDNVSNDVKNHWEVLGVDTSTVINSGDVDNNFENITATLNGPGRYAVRQWVTDNDKVFGDAGFSSDTCIAFFSVLDTITPVLDSKPVNMTINVTTACDTTFAPDVPNVTENCVLDSTGYLITNNINGDTLYIGSSAAGNVTFPAIIDFSDNVIYTYSFYFEDMSGNKVSYAYNIFVNDTIVPELNTNIFDGGTTHDTTITTIAACDTTITIPASLLGVSDNCMIASVKNGNNELLNTTTSIIANVVVTLTDTVNVYYFTTTDYSGNSVTDSIIVRKADSGFPVLNGGTPYANIDEYNSINSCEYVYSVNHLNDLLQVTDNCGIDSVFISIDLDVTHSAGIDTTIGFTEAELVNPFSFGFPASQLNDGNDSQTHIVNVSAKDNSGNITSSSFNVTVHDSINPQIFLEDSVVYYVNGNDCNSVTILSTDSRADIFGNQLGTVNDNCASDARLLENMVNDNPASALVGDSLFGNFPLGTTVVTFTTNDGNSNFFSQSIKVIVVDTIAPNSVVNVINTTTNDSTCTATITINSPVTISDDNCGVDSVEYSLDGITYIGLDSLNASFDNTFDLDSTTVYWRSYDQAGNSTEFTSLVIVKDAFKPTLTLSNADLKFYASANECAKTITLPAAVVNENCGIDSVVSVLRTVQGTLDTSVTFVNTPVVADLLAVDFAAPATYTLTTLAYDVNGNISDTLKNFITYADTIDPVINAIDTIYLKTDSLMCTTTIELDSLGTAYGLNISDNCGINSILYNFLNTPGSFNDTSFSATAGTYDFEVNVLDNSTNYAKRAFTIVVESTFDDKILSAPADTVFTNVFANECSKNVTFDSLVVNTCGIRYAIVSSIASGSLFEIGNTNVAWYVIDNGDTLFTYNFVVAVIDNQDPVIRQAPQDITLYVGSDCSVQYNYVLDVQDNCDAQGLTVNTSVPSGSILGVGTFTNNYTVADESGNTVSGSNIVTVLDTLSPSFSAFPTNIETCDAQVDYVVTGSDNCSGATVTLESGLASGSTFNLGVTTVTYKVTDASGNSATQSFTVTVLPQATTADAGTDTEVCISDATFALSGNVLASGETGTWSVLPSLASITDVNSPTSDVSFTSAGIYTFTWTVDNGQCTPNSSNVTIIVSDEPVAIAGADQSVETTTATLDGVTDNGSFAWTTNSTATITNPANINTTVDALEVGANVFVLTVANAACGSVSDSLTITLEPKAFRDDIVAGFTPNGDGVNDTWTLPGIENYPNATVKIFNRWGSIVFETTTPATEAWDGTNEGEILPVASYYYVIDLGDGSKEVNGIISIIK
jgi:gliding motility-associated-like protein